MNKLGTLHSELRNFLLSWLEAHVPGYSQVAFEGLVVFWIFLCAIVIHFVLHALLRQLVVRFAHDRWRRSLLDQHLLRRVSYVVQAAIVYVQSGFWLDNSSSLLGLIESSCYLWMLLFGLLAFFSLLNIFQVLIYQRTEKTQFPIRGLLQTVKLISSIVVCFLAISLLMGKSPVLLLSGLGALSAVLLLVFKDPLLGLVAGIQLSANDMLSVGDWLEMPKYGADGEVIDIALTTVKVRNWDNTITTVPTYALISDSFKNWRGMVQSGGRRIKRSVLLDTSSIRFVDDEILEQFRQSGILDACAEEYPREIGHENSQTPADIEDSINGQRLTNASIFRRYLVAYLKNHPNIHQEMTLMVRQLNPSSDGLPIEIYTFTSTTNWNEYEDIQSELFDHVFAILPEFSLRAHESPTGHDIRSLRLNNGRV